MSRWFAMLGGLLVWAAHFLGLYLIASAADVWTTADSPMSRWIGLAFSLACLGAVAVLTLIFARRPIDGEAARWERRIAITGAMVAAVAIIWQMAPLAF